MGLLDGVNCLQENILNEQLLFNPIFEGIVFLKS
jgi:hypothetical protein